MLEARVHNLFDLKGANEGEIPLTKHFEIGIVFFGTMGS